MGQTTSVALKKRSVLKPKWNDIKQSPKPLLGISNVEEEVIPFFWLISRLALDSWRGGGTCLVSVTVGAIWMWVLTLMFVDNFSFLICGAVYLKKMFIRTYLSNHLIFRNFQSFPRRRCSLKNEYFEPCLSSLKICHTRIIYIKHLTI